MSRWKETLVNEDELVLVDDEDVESANRGQVVDWARVCATARANPTKWVKVPVRMEASTAGHINYGRYASVDAAEFQAISRNNQRDAAGKRTADIYLRVRA